MKKRSSVFLLLGSNVGDRAAILASARAEIEREIGHISKKSGIYETEPWGLADQPPFFNQAIEVETELSPDQVLAKTKAIEADAGRERAEKWGPRTLDIDILLFENSVIDTPALRIPHPELPSRNFALVPLMEIAGERIHPTLGEAIEDLYMKSSDELEVILLEG